MWRTCQDIPWITDHCLTCHTKQDGYEERNNNAGCLLYLSRFEGDLLWCCCLAWKLLNPGEVAEELLCDHAPLAP